MASCLEMPVRIAAGNGTQNKTSENLDVEFCFARRTISKCWVMFDEYAAPGKAPFHVVNLYVTDHARSFCLKVHGYSL